MSESRKVAVPRETWTVVTDEIEVYQVQGEREYAEVWPDGSITLVSPSMLSAWIVRVRKFCTCGAGAASPEYHDVIACPIGRAQYERDHPNER